MSIDFRYPLAVIAGKNGTGKSTLLACAACAYHNTGPYELWGLGGKYFRFTDFFFTTSQEAPLLNVQVRWTYRLEDRTVHIRTVTKSASRWQGYSNRPNRAVEFVGLLRALHPSELHVLRRHFGAERAAQPVSLDITHQATISHVMTRSYAAVRLGTSGRYSLHYLDADGMCYSGFNMGSGEDVMCQLARIVHRLPQSSLLIIEEIEVGLHPAAQRNLMRQLLDLCWEKRLQVICSSHSQTVLECVPTEARVLMVRHGSTLQPRYAVSVGEAISDMTMLPVSELVVYVEDELARNLLLRALPASIRQRVRVTTCGSWEDMIRFLATFRRDPTLGPVAALLDGERQGHDAEHVDSFRRYLGGGMTDLDRQWLTDRVHYLPGAAPPESYLRALGTDPAFRESLAVELNADAGVVEEFFRGPLPGDDHSLAYNLGLRVGLDHGQTEAALVGAAIRSKPADFQPIVAFLEQRLTVET
jgi:energy-coupling factor transporter ATP-binding protein EcfA2